MATNMPIWLAIPTEFAEKEKTSHDGYSGVHASAERLLSRWAARDIYTPCRHLRMLTAKPAAKPWTFLNVLFPLIEPLIRAYY